MVFRAIVKTGYISIAIAIAITVISISTICTSVLRIYVGVYLRGN